MRGTGSFSSFDSGAIYMAAAEAPKRDGAAIDLDRRFLPTPSVGCRRYGPIPCDSGAPWYQRRVRLRGRVSLKSWLQVQSGGSTSQRAGRRRPWTSSQPHKRKLTGIPIEEADTHEKA